MLYYKQEFGGTTRQMRMVKDKRFLPYKVLPVARVVAGLFSVRRRRLVTLEK